MDVQVLAAGQHLLQLLLIGLHIGLRTAQGLLHIAGAGLAPVLIVAVGAEGQPHGLDVIEDLLRRHGLRHFHAEAGVVAQAAGAVDIEGAVGTGGKAQIPVGGVGHVGGRVGEAHLQLPGHPLRLDEVHQVLTCGLCPGQHVEVLPFLYAGQGRAGHVPGEVSAAAHGDNAAVQGALHDGTHRLRRQVVELDGLAGGEMSPGHGIRPDGLGREGQLLLGHAARGHPQAQHAGLAALLGIAAIQAGETLVGRLVQLSGIERRGLLPESRQVLFPALGINVVHFLSTLFHINSGHVLIGREVDWEIPIESIIKYPYTEVKSSGGLFEIISFFDEKSRPARILSGPDSLVF